MRSIRVVLLLLITILMSSCILTTDIYSSFKTFYWIEKGKFFVYRVRIMNASNGVDVDYAQILIGDRVANVSYLAYPRDVEISWKVLHTDGDYIYVEYVLKIKKCIDDRNRTITNLSIIRRYLIDLRTLDVYVRNGSKSEWVGEWPFLVHPRIAVNGGPKLISFSRSKALLALSQQTYEQILEQGAGKCIEPFSINEGVKIVFNASGRVAVQVKNGIVYFTNIKPSPVLENYCIPHNGVCISKDRIVGLPLNIWETPGVSFEDIARFYNDSLRPTKVLILSLSTSGVNYELALLMYGDECYLVDETSMGIAYDSVTGILLREFTTVPITILSLRDLIRRFDIDIWPLSLSIRPEIVLVLELVSTNVDFGRPVIGGLGNVNVSLIVAISIAIPSLSLLYVTLRRRRAG